MEVEKKLNTQINSYKFQKSLKENEEYNLDINLKDGNKYDILAFFSLKETKKNRINELI